LTNEEKLQFYEAIGYKDDKVSDQVYYPQQVRLIFIDLSRIILVFFLNLVCRFKYRIEIKFN